MQPVRPKQHTRYQRIRYAVQEHAIRRALADLTRGALATDPGETLVSIGDTGQTRRAASKPQTPESNTPIRARSRPLSTFAGLRDPMDCSGTSKSSTVRRLCGPRVREGPSTRRRIGRPFRGIVGIDLSARLASIAEQNARIIGARFPARAPTEIQIGDAAAFDVPNTPLLVHLYHPFQTDVTARVLQSLQHSHEREPRRIAVAHLLYTKVG